MRDGIPETREELEVFLEGWLGVAEIDQFSQPVKTQEETNRARAYWFCAILDAHWKSESYDIKDWAEEILEGTKPVDDEWVKDWLFTNFHEVNGWEDPDEERVRQKANWEESLEYFMS